MTTFDTTPPDLIGQKSSATATFTLGLLSLFPGWGLILGPIGWWMGNRELREIDQGFRSAQGRSKATVGRVFAVAGTAISVVAVALVTWLGLPRPAQPDWIAEQNITFVAPRGWRTMELDAHAPPVQQYAVTPDRSSGNWIALAYFPESVAGELFGPNEDRIATMMDDARDFGDTGPLRLIRGPEEVEVSGLTGVTFALDGLVGERTGQPLSAESLFLLDGEAVYMLIVQYEPDDEDMMLSAWERVLADLRVQ